MSSLRTVFWPWPEVDLALPPAALRAALRQAEREGVALALEIPLPSGWSGSPSTAANLEPIVDRAREAWIVQRPGCAGLVTRVVLTDAPGEAFASVATRSGPGPEPIAWRVALLLGVLGASDAASRLAAK